MPISMRCASFPSFSPHFKVLFGQRSYHYQTGEPLNAGYYSRYYQMDEVFLLFLLRLAITLSWPG